VELTAHAQYLNVADEDLVEYGHELGLALACARQDEYAIEQLETCFLLKISRAVGTRLRVASDFGDDTMQELRARLLVGPSPKLLSYAAKGPLEGWLRRAAQNVGIRRAKRQRSSFEVNDVEGLLSNTPGCERIHPVAQRVLDDVLLRLSQDDRRLLALHSRGITIDYLSATFGSHRATWARQLATLRARVRKDVTDRLSAEIEVSKTEASLELERVALNLSLGVLLATDSSQPDELSSNARPAQADADGTKMRSIFREGGAREQAGPAAAPC